MADLNYTMRYNWAYETAFSILLNNTDSTVADPAMVAAKASAYAHAYASQPWPSEAAGDPVLED